MRRKTAITFFTIMFLSIIGACIFEYLQYQNAQDMNKKLNQVIIELKK